MEKSISKIKEEICNTVEEKELEQLISRYKNDERKGVKQLLLKIEKQKLALQAEYERLENMKEFEYKYDDFHYIAGIDEVGRGPLAGPVVAGAVILPKDCNILYLNDSKKLSAKRREQLFDEIMNKALAVSIGMVSPARIDEINILQATFEAMKEAIAGLLKRPDILLVDAIHIPELPMKQVGIIKGDERSISIAAASIIAKVTRDRIMQGYDKIYRNYNFSGNKGYGSKAHIQAIREYGPSPIHRTTFIKNFV